MSTVRNPRRRINDLNPTLTEPVWKCDTSQNPRLRRGETGVVGRGGAADPHGHTECSGVNSSRPTVGRSRGIKFARDGTARVGTCGQDGEAAGSSERAKLSRDDETPSASRTTCPRGTSRRERRRVSDLLRRPVRWRGRGRLRPDARFGSRGGEIRADRAGQVPRCGKETPRHRPACVWCKQPSITLERRPSKRTSVRSGMPSSGSPESIQNHSTTFNGPATPPSFWKIIRISSARHKSFSRRLQESSGPD